MGLINCKRGWKSNLAGVLKGKNGYCSYLVTMEKETATHSSTLAWRIPWTEEPGGLQSTGCTESDTTERLHFTSLHFCYNVYCCCCRSVAKVCPSLCDPTGLQHAKLPCPPLSPQICLRSCPLSQWCHPTILSSVIPFSCLQSFPATLFSNESALRIKWPKY